MSQKKTQVQNKEEKFFYQVQVYLDALSTFFQINCYYENQNMKHNRSPHVKDHSIMLIYVVYV